MCKFWIICFKIADNKSASFCGNGKKQSRKGSRSKTRTLYFEIPLLFQFPVCYYTNVTLHLNSRSFICSLTVSICAATLHLIFFKLVAVTRIYFLTIIIIIIKSYKLKLRGL